MVKTISPNQLSSICRNLSIQRCKQITDSLNKAIQTYNIPYAALPEFIANVAHESGEFTIKAENLNYTTPERLVAIWPSRFTVKGEKGKNNAKDFVRNPAKLANEVYNGRMGNKIGSNDGYAFRGGGFAQITGREAYLKYLEFVCEREESNRTPEEIASLVQTNDDWAMDSAAWFFCEFKNLEQLAIDDNFLALVKRWNGGTIGIEERKKYYNRALAVLK